MFSLNQLQDRVYIIAEMSANHAGKLENALAIVRAAAEAGADCLKIQTYTADTLTIDCENEHFRIKGGLWDGYTLYDLYKEAGTPWEWHAAIKKECGLHGLDFLSSPFDNTAVDFLDDLGVDFFKIASFELVDIPLIKYAASKGKPLVISCGMGSAEEIQDAVDACHAQGNDQVILLKCCSEYPANWADMNLWTIPDMRTRFGTVIGLSDHSMGSLAAVVGVSLGARVVEKHFCLSREIENPDSAFSMEPEEFAQMVQDIRAVEQILGKADYTLTEREKNSTVFRRSLFAVQDIARGELFTEQNVRSIRPGFGLKPILLEGVLGKPSPIAYQRGEPLQPFLATNKQDAFFSKRLLYRALDIEHTDMVAKWRSDPLIYKYFGEPRPVASEEHSLWYDTCYLPDPTRIEYVIYCKSGEVPIGTVGVQRLDFAQKNCEIGYTVGEVSFQKQGYASEAIDALVQRYHRLFGLTQFVAIIHPQNEASLRTVQKLGFKQHEQMGDDGFIRMLKQL